jgi:hypothetical protein
MIHKPYSVVCEFDGCNRSTPKCCTAYTVMVWLLGNRWEATWRFEFAGADPSFRVRCPDHWQCRE